MAVASAYDPSLAADDLRIAGFAVLEEIVRAPGTTMVRACHPSGRAVLLQITRCRAPSSSKDRDDWLEMTRRIACATSEVRASLLPGILHHGVVSEPDGSTMLYWVLPWHDAVRRIGHADTLVRTLDDLLKVASGLLEILVARHEAGWVEPLLSEKTIIVGCGEPVRIAGAPIYVDRGWEDTNAEPARRAPEEIAHRSPSRSGDLWRVGQTLLALSSGIELPGSVSALIESLAHPDPRCRPSSAQSALANLKRMIANRMSGIRWSDPYAEEPTLLTVMPQVHREPDGDVCASPTFVLDRANDHVEALNVLSAMEAMEAMEAIRAAEALQKAKVDAVKEARRRHEIDRRLCRERLLTIALQAFCVFVASAALTLFALELLA